MKVCFPVLVARGLESEVYGHFGSAPEFVLVDTANSNVMVIQNSDQHHKHGECNPLNALNNQWFDAVVVGGIGAGALNRLNQLGIRVFQAQALTVKENLLMLGTHKLPEFTLSHCCPGHGHGFGCGH